MSLRAAMTAGLVGLAMSGGCAPGPPDDAAATPATPAQSTRSDGPVIRVVGTVQDGGLPHAACDCVRCDAARSDRSRSRRVACLAVLQANPPRTFLIDATPDIRAQLDAVADWKGFSEGRVDRDPVDGVLLTHAHMGHYSGLAFLGFEAIHTRGVPVYCSASMCEFLGDNGPWDQLVRLQNIERVEIGPGLPFPLTDEIRVVPLSAPHRREYTDTLGFMIHGPRRVVLYVPDTDSWRAWDPPLTHHLDGVDVAILDGTFYSAAELPGRNVDSIGHPLIVESMELLDAWTDRVEIYFTHLNHSNPALDPRSPELREMKRRGFAVLEELQELPL